MGKSAITELTHDLVIHLNLDLGISSQLGHPFEPRSWNLQSTRLDCHHDNSLNVGFNHIFLGDLSTYSC